jgi:Tfp pilus assembly protein PilF
VSQIFDSLRRSRQPPARATTARTAHGDAVLATLGYAPVRRDKRYSAAVISAIVIGLVAIVWLGWRFYFHAGTRPVAVHQTAPRTSQSEVRHTIPPASPGEPNVPEVSKGVSESVPKPSQATELAAPVARRSAGSSSHADSIAPAGSGAKADAGSRTTDPDTIASRQTVPASPRDNDLELALYYHRAGDFPNALQRYRALLERDELNAQAHNNLGLLYQERNLLQESARELQRATLIEPRNAGTHNNYGVTLLRLGRLDEAVAEFQTALSLDRRNLDALVNLGQAERTAGQLDTAKETLLRVLNVAPQHAAAHYNLAQLYDETNEPARAVEHYRLFLDNAGADLADRGAAVRARIAALSRIPE